MPKAPRCEKHNVKKKQRGGDNYWYCPECRKARQRAYYLKTKDIQREQQKAARKADPEKYRRRNALGYLKRKYGMTEKEYLKLLKKQGGVCAICKVETVRVGRAGPTRLCVDHDHETSKVRGILCHNCNVLLGHAKDSTKLLKAAVKYLKEHDGGGTKQGSFGDNRQMV